jgi:predicted HD phosphohydrolase
MITAALLHDVGHLILDEHDSDSEFLEQNLEHEAVGHTFLKSRFSERVAAISLNHVDAKRWVTLNDSPASSLVAILCV